VYAVGNAPVSNLPLGPSPVRAPAQASALSGPRSRVLELLQRRAGPATIAELAGELGVHANTAREHLDALVDRGLATREAAPARGRGRPAWTYFAATDAVEPDPRVRDYAGLATALAAHIARTSADPAADALAAGTAWGRELAAERPVGPAGRGSARARRQVVGLLDELGFDPQPDARVTTAALRRCPLLDAARRHPEVVCQVHLGIVRGALEVLGGEPDGTQLVPFAEPGACRLDLVPRG
jgi:predicted ArsR family transcriptional regulator